MLLRTPAAAPGGGAAAVLAVGQQVKVLATVSQKAQKPFAGKTGQIVWTFNRAGQFEFACLIAGHYQAGMTGRFTVTE